MDLNLRNTAIRSLYQKSTLHSTFPGISDTVLVKDKGFWLVADCRCFQGNVSIKQKLPVNDKGLKKAVVNLIPIICKTERSEENS